ncbi:endonuclease III, partial [Candidatus Dojkabacteria bacterium]|nr:endonuclease III [Candidatus Dojkabacteria bacterium]
MTERNQKILALLKKQFPIVSCPLNHSSAHELLFATILSAQCTDARVNMVTPALFAKYKSIKDFAGADPEELKQIIRSTGFYNNKAKNIIA